MTVRKEGAQQFSRFSSETMFDQNLVVGLIAIGVLVMVVYAYLSPRGMRGMLSGIGMEGFADAKKNGKVATPAANGSSAQMTSGAPGQKKMDMANANVAPTAMPAPAKAPAPAASEKKEGFADFASYGGSDTLGAVPMAGAQKPQGCYPREQMNPADLLPSDVNSQWAQVNPTGAGDIQGKNFLSAGALIGVNTIGQSLRNANLQLRAEPANPQAQVSPWLQSTIEPDLSRRSIDA
jgi:hypothetical protein